MLDGPVVVKDNALAGTSAWANTFLRPRPPGPWENPCVTRGVAQMAYGSLEEKLEAAGSAVEMARNSQIGPYVYPAVPAEFSNWRDEQAAWRDTSALFDQSHHMTDLYLEGPDVIRLLSDLGVNTFGNAAVNKAEQFVACNPDGYVIQDGILLFPRREPGEPRRPPLGPQLGPLPRGYRRIRRRRRAGRTHGRQPDRGAGSSTGSRSRARPRSTSSARRRAGCCRRSRSSTWAS